VTILIVLGVLLIVAVVVMVFNVVVGRRDDEAREPERWAGNHGLDLTDASRPWVAAYLRTGRNLRQVCGFGGLVVAASVTAATGLDLYVSGLVWVLLGYLVGCLWAELASNATIAQPQRGSSASSGLSRAPSQRRPLSWLVRPAHWRSFAAPRGSHANGAHKPSSWLGCRHLVDADAKSSAHAPGKRGHDGRVHAARSTQR